MDIEKFVEIVDQNKSLKASIYRFFKLLKSRNETSHTYEIHTYVIFEKPYLTSEVLLKNFNNVGSRVFKTFYS